MKIVTTRKVFHVFASEKAALVRFKIFAFPFFFLFLFFFFLSGLGVSWRNLVTFEEKRRMISFKFTYLWENVIYNISYAQK